MTIITNFIPMPILYFMYGYILSKEKNNRLVKNISIFFLIVAISIPTYIATCLMLQKQSYFFLDDYRNIYTFIITTALFIIVKYCFENFKKENVFTKIINHLSNNSYGIYLIHVFILEYILNTPLIKELSGFHKLEAISIVIISTLIISDIIITILKSVD